jgi:restriction endonuclease Mrr
MYRVASVQRGRRIQICEQYRIGQRPLWLTMGVGQLNSPQEQSMGKQHSAGEQPNSLIDRLSSNGNPALSAVAADDLLAVSGLSRKEVERLVAEAYRNQGYQVEALGAGAAESDAGMLLTKATQHVLLQCKYWKTRKLAEMPVRELYGMMAAHSANAGILITSGSFTLEASRFAGYGRIQLIDGPRLLAMLREGAARGARVGAAEARPPARANSAAR